ncbi:DUF6119 family protein [Streptomyces hydrogenans]|uniref:Uncharacterized protein n=1 Tax=Streptomyces hydrogenans TaxID=1873719 RepID=A0ABQ3PQ57_9ACTN|nr:DUF6119 family protein [Streptomyces hydrogenans]GHI27144.1 hypothetical protein Shyd_85150 [Streptomyces hydrogenans]
MDARQGQANAASSRWPPTPDHHLLEDFGTRRVVFGIRLKDGQDISVTSLFAFAQVSLIQAARRLHDMNAHVGVIAIRR